MKESWVRPDMEVLDVKETAFGPQNPKMPDSDKTAVIGPVSYTHLDVYKRQFIMLPCFFIWTGFTGS